MRHSVPGDPLRLHSEVSRSGTRLGPIALIAVLTAGCTYFEQERVGVFLRAPASLYSWEARGKVAVTADTSTETANFTWQRQNPHADIVTFSGPLAMKQTTLERQGNKLLRKVGDSLRRVDLDASTDPISTALTMLPPEAIGNWLLGYTSDRTEWRVEVSEWHNSAPWQAPKRVTIRGIDMEIRVIISRWAFEPIP